MSKESKLYLRETAAKIINDTISEAAARSVEAQPLQLEETKDHPGWIAYRSDPNLQKSNLACMRFREIDDRLRASFRGRFLNELTPQEQAKVDRLDSLRHTFYQRHCQIAWNLKQDYGILGWMPKTPTEATGIKMEPVARPEVTQPAATQTPGMARPGRAKLTDEKRNVLVREYIAEQQKAGKPINRITRDGIVEALKQRGTPIAAGAVSGTQAWIALLEQKAQAKAAPPMPDAVIPNHVDQVIARIDWDAVQAQQEKEEANPTRHQ